MYLLPGLMPYHIPALAGRLTVQAFPLRRGDSLARNRPTAQPRACTAFTNSTLDGHGLVCYSSTVCHGRCKA
nr:MAG TPA: hypothetical protein [Caudoviricetes sp.]